MNSSSQRGVINENQDGKGARGDEPIQSGTFAGRYKTHATKLGAGCKCPPQIGSRTGGANSRLGGQRSISLFGCPGVKAPAAPTKVWPGRIKGALSARDRDGLTDAHYATPTPPRRVDVDLHAPGTRIDHAALDAEERREIEAEEARTRAATTPAMRRAARESQLREEREWYDAARAQEEESYMLFLDQWIPHCNALRAREEAA